MQPQVLEDSAAPPSPHGRFITAVVAVAIAAGAVSLYVPSFGCKFLNLDDFQYIVDNPYVLRPSWEHARAFFNEWQNPTTVGGYYQPLTMVSLMLDRLIDGTSKPIPDPNVFHATNVVLHAANCMLLFVWLLRLTRSLPAAAVGAVLFAVHPMNVESVTWICQRKSLLATLFSLAALLAYDRHARRPGIGWLTATTLMFLLALLSKPISVTLPLFLLLLDFWPYRRLTVSALLEKLPMFILAAAFGWVAYISQKAGAGAVASDLQVILTKRPLIICHNITFYFTKLIWPFKLCPQYPAPPLDAIKITAAPFAWGVVGTLALIALLIVFRRCRAVWVGVLGFLILINPVILGLVDFQGSIAGDRFVYLPMIALALMLAAGVAALVTRSSAARVCLAGLAIAVALGFSWKTWRQQGVFLDSISYWEEVVRQYPDDAFCRMGLGRAWLLIDRNAAAESEFRRAIELNPRLPMPYFRLGEVLFYEEKPFEAREWLDKGLAIAPKDPDGNFFLGRVLYRLGEVDKTVEPFRIAVEARPNWREALFNLGNGLLRAGKGLEALPIYARLVKLEPDNPAYLYSWAVALTEAQEDLAAFNALRQAVAIKPDDGNMQFALAACAASVGDTDQAWSSLEAALKIRPELVDLAAAEPRFKTMRESPRWRVLMISVEGAAAAKPN